MASYIKLNLSFNSDEDGFFRRECPTCTREFKWEPSLESTDNATYFCPYCGVSAPGDHWWTTEQLQFIQAARIAKAKADVVEQLKAGFQGSKYLKFTSPSQPDFNLEPPAEDNDMVVADFLCHPESRIKVDGLGQPLFCLICGGSRGAAGTVEDGGTQLSTDRGGTMRANWRIHYQLLRHLAKATDGDIAGVDDGDLHGNQLSVDLDAQGLGLAPRKLRAQLDYLQQKGYITLVAPKGSGIEPLECFCKIRATGQEIVGTWDNTSGRATLLLDLIYRASHDKIEGVRTHHGDVFYSDQLAGRMQAESPDHVRLLEYLEGKGLVEISWIDGRVPMKIALTSRGTDRVEGISLDANMRRDQPNSRQDDKLTLLFLAANPIATQPLALDLESRDIEEKISMAMGSSETPQKITVVSAWAVRPDDLLHQLNKVRPNFVHFSGHGGPGELYLCDSQGNPKPVNTAALKALFKTLKDNIKVVVLNACYTEQQAKAINEEIDYVVGMSVSISDEAARVFSASFYRALAFRRSIEESFDQAIAALLLEGIPEEDTPVLLRKQPAAAAGQ